MISVSRLVSSYFIKWCASFWDCSRFLREKKIQPISNDYLKCCTLLFPETHLPTKSTNKSSEFDNVDLFLLLNTVHTLDVYQLWQCIQGHWYQSHQHIDQPCECFCFTVCTQLCVHAQLQCYLFCFLNQTFSHSHPIRMAIQLCKFAHFYD